MIILTESVSSIESINKISNSVLKDCANKFNGTFKKNTVQFNNPEDYYDAVKFLQSSNCKNHTFIFASAEYGTGYNVKAKDYKL